jgi:hypothetical protein
MCEMDSLRSIMGNPAWASLLRAMNGDAEQVQARAVSVSWINGPTKLLGIHTIGVACKPLRDFGGNFLVSRIGFARVYLHIKRYAFTFPFCLCLYWSSRYLYVVFVHSFARPFTIHTSYHIRSVFKTAPFPQHEVLHHPQRARPCCRCRCSTDYS